MLAGDTATKAGGPAKIALVLATVLLSATTASAQQSSAIRLTPDRSYELEVPEGFGASVLAFDGESLWVGAQAFQGPGLFQKYSLDGELLADFKSRRRGHVVGGLTFDGESLHSLSYNTRLNGGRQGIDEFTLGGAVVKQHKAAGGPHNTFGLAWNGKGFYQGHSPTVRPRSVIYRLDARGRVVSARKMPFYTRGLAFDGKYLWVSTSQYRKLYVLDSRLDVVEVFDTEMPLAGITWANGALWGLEHNSSRLHRFSIQSI